MHHKDLNFLEEAFKKYYFDQFDLIHVPNKPAEREFGYRKFNSGMIRHLSVRNDKELHLMLIQNKPSDVFCSNACYSFPNLPMPEKDWKEADLIFDIDSKDLFLECRKSHTCLICQSCGNVFVGLKNCAKCNSSKFEMKSLACLDCISAAKQEVKKLLRIITEDLGINSENIQVYFSGNEGFHVYVFNSEYQKLNSKERSELVDYIMFRGVIPETFGFKKYKPDKSLLPELNEGGWRGRVSKHLFGSKSRRSKLISKLISKGYQNFHNQLKTISDELGAKIDPSVTMDTHRIFRLPGSLNSKSGLSKLLCKNLEKFNPFNEACYLSGTPIEIKANCPIQFIIKNKKFGPYNNEIITVPTYSAVYMICKNLATIS